MNELGDGSATARDASGPVEAEAADADAASGDGGVDADTGYGRGPSVCSAMPAVGATTAVTTSTEDRFGSISDDELTIVWTVPSGNDAAIRWADRAATTDAFGAAQTANVAVVIARDRVAVTPDGLGLLAVAADHRSFVVFERATRDDVFVAGSSAMMDNLIAALAPTELVGDPVYTFGDQGLLYSVYGASPDTVRFASRLTSTSAFDDGGSLAFAELRASGALRRRPTGAGADFQTLFYYDETTQTEKLARLAGTIGVFSVVDLGAHPLAQPNSACTRVYFGNTGLSTATLR